MSFSLSFLASFLVVCCFCFRAPDERTWLLFSYFFEKYQLWKLVSCLAFMLIRKHGHSLLFRQYSTVTNKLHRWVLVRNFNGAFGAIQWRWLYIFQKCVEKLGILFICFQKAQLAIAHSANLILSDQPRHFPRLNLIKFKNWFLLDLVIRQLNKHDLYGCRICLLKKKKFLLKAWNNFCRLDRRRLRRYWLNVC